jgi:hypothetical protein
LGQADSLAEFGHGEEKTANFLTQIRDSEASRPLGTGLYHLLQGASQRLSWCERFGPFVFGFGKGKYVSLFARADGDLLRDQAGMDGCCTTRGDRKSSLEEVRGAAGNSDYRNAVDRMSRTFRDIFDCRRPRDFQFLAEIGAKFRNVSDCEEVRDVANFVVLP